MVLSGTHQRIKVSHTKAGHISSFPLSFMQLFLTGYVIRIVGSYSCRVIGRGKLNEAQVTGLAISC